MDQLKDNGTVSKPYWKIVCFDQREGRMVGKAKWSSYWNHIEATSGAAVVNQKNLVVARILKKGPT